MSEHEQVTQEAEPEQGGRDRGQSGIVKGVAGKHLSVNGVLDLRGVPAEQVAQIETLHVRGVVLLDEANRGALAGIAPEINGTVMVADPDMRILVQPNLDLTKAMVEAMPAGQKLMLIGTIYISPDVPPALLAEKFADLRLVGIIIASESAQGALFGKLEIVGISITLAADTGVVIRSIGNTEWTEEYLSRLEDGATYVNVGRTEIPISLSEELIARKIRAYHNVGQTVAAKSILALLKSRGGTDMGSFDVLEEE